MVDNNTGIQIGDKPIFGVDITISEKIKDFIGSIVQPGVVIGWVNFVGAGAFACLTNDGRYIEASKFLSLEKNQIVLSQQIKLHGVAEDLSSSKYIFTFKEII